jgi:hypothetical protein
MEHVYGTIFSEQRSWSGSPPTGRQLAAELRAIIGEADHVGRLAQLCGRSENYVRLQLGQNTVVPACLLTAAIRYRSECLRGGINTSA